MGKDYLIKPFGPRRGAPWNHSAEKKLVKKVHCTSAGISEKGGRWKKRKPLDGDNSCRKEKPQKTIARSDEDLHKGGKSSGN